MPRITRTDSAGNALEIDGAKVVAGPYGSRAEVVVAHAEVGMELACRSGRISSGVFIELNGKHYAVEVATQLM